MEHVKSNYSLKALCSQFGREVSKSELQFASFFDEYYLSQSSQTFQISEIQTGECAPDLVEQVFNQLKNNLYLKRFYSLITLKRGGQARLELCWDQKCSTPAVAKLYHVANTLPLIKKSSWDEFESKSSFSYASLTSISALFGHPSLLRECEAYRRLYHSPYVPHFLEFGYCEDSKESLLVLPYLKGPDWSEFSQNTSPELALEAAIILSEAVQSVHDQSLVHGDLSGRNLKVQGIDSRFQKTQANLQLHLIDWGLSNEFDRQILALSSEASSNSLSSESSFLSSRVVGTLPYADWIQSPEGYKKPNNEIYSLGVLLLEVFAGGLQKLDLNKEEIESKPNNLPKLLMHSIERVIPDRDLQLILKKCLVNPGHGNQSRYLKAEHVRVDLELYKNRMPLLYCKQRTLPYILKTYVKRRPWVTLSSAIVLLLSLIFVSEQYSAYLKNRLQRDLIFKLNESLEYEKACEKFKAVRPLTNDVKTIEEIEQSIQFFEQLAAKVPRLREIYKSQLAHSKVLPISDQKPDIFLEELKSLEQQSKELIEELNQENSAAKFKLVNLTCQLTKLYNSLQALFLLDSDQAWKHYGSLDQFIQSLSTLQDTLSQNLGDNGLVQNKIIFEQRLNLRQHLKVFAQEARKVLNSCSFRDEIRVFSEENYEFESKRVKQLLQQLYKVKTYWIPLAKKHKQLCVEGRVFDWSEVLKDLKSNPRYKSLKSLKNIRALPGLQPVGKNAQGLWEFCDRRTGICPESPAGSIKTTNITRKTGVIFILVPGGQGKIGYLQDRKYDYGENGFLNRVPEDDEGYPGGIQVDLDAFLLSKYEINQAQWTRVMLVNRSSRKPGMKPRLGAESDVVTLLNPVERVSWRDAQDMCQILGWQLPTEAQWEFSARAGRTDMWPVDRAVVRTDMGAYGNFADKTYKTVGGRFLATEVNDGFGFHSKVGQYLPNAFGFHDFCGNVSEWCLDRYTAYPDSANTSPPRLQGKGLLEGRTSYNRSIRGGHWYSVLAICRTAQRENQDPDNRQDNLGFRPAYNFSN